MNSKPTFRFSIADSDVVYVQAIDHADNRYHCPIANSIDDLEECIRELQTISTLAHTTKDMNYCTIDKTRRHCDDCHITSVFYIPIDSEGVTPIDVWCPICKRLFAAAGRKIDIEK